MEEPQFLKSILNLDIGEEFENIKDEDIAQVQKGSFFVHFLFLIFSIRIGFISKDKGTIDEFGQIISDGKYILR